MLDTTRMRFPLDIILICIRWYEAYPLSYRQLEEMMHEGVYLSAIPQSVTGRINFFFCWKNISPT